MAGAWSWPRTTSIIEVKNQWRYTLISIRLHGIDVDTFTATITSNATTTTTTTAAAVAAGKIKIVRQPEGFLLSQQCSSVLRSSGAWSGVTTNGFRLFECGFETSRTSLPRTLPSLRMRPLRCLETSSTNYPAKRRHVPDGVHCVTVCLLWSSGQDHHHHHHHRHNNNNNNNNHLISGLFFLIVLLLNLRLQVSYCSTFNILCDVTSIAVCCSESIECFPGMASKFFFKIFVTIPVAPVTTGIIVHFMFHIRYIYIHKHFLVFLLVPCVWHSCPLVLPRL